MATLQENQSLFGFYVKNDDNSIETINYDKEGLRDPRIRYSVKLFRENIKHFIGKLETTQKDNKTFALLSSFNELSKEIMPKPKLQFFDKENGDIISLDTVELKEIQTLFETYPDIPKTLGVTDRALINDEVYLCLSKVRKIVKYFKENPIEEEDQKPTPEEQKQIDIEAIKDLITEVEPDKTLQDLILNTQTEIELSVVVKKIKAFYTDDYYREKIKLSGQSIKNRLLFFGPPGTGKTSLANAIAKELDKKLWICSLADLSSKYVGESEKNLKLVLNKAQEAEVVLLIDEADAIFVDRQNANLPQHSVNLVNSALALLNEYQGIIVLTTNSTKRIDPAMARRFNYVIEVGLLDKEAMIRVCKLYLNKFAGHIAEDIDYETIFKRIDSMSPALIETSVVKAFDVAYMQTAEKIITTDILKTQIEMNSNNFNRFGN